jgi:hypothetical protein
MICSSREVPSVQAQGLRLTAGEQRGAVDARQVTDLALDGADLVELAAVGTGAVIEDRVAEQALFGELDGGLDLVGGVLRLLDIFRGSRRPRSLRRPA